MADQDILKQNALAENNSPDKQSAAQELIGRLRNTPAQVDLSPLLAYADSEFGTKLSKAYKRPKSRNDNLLLAAKLELKLSEAQAKQRTRLAKAMGVSKGKEIDNVARRNIIEGQTIPTILGQVSQEIDVNKNMFGPIEGRARSLNPWDVESQAMDSRLRSASQLFGKFMEGGVLRKEDEEKYRKMFPQLQDDTEVAQRKLENVQSILATKHNLTIENYAAQGFNIDGIDPIDAPILEQQFTEGERSLAEWAIQNPNHPKAQAVIDKAGNVQLEMFIKARRTPIKKGK